MSIVNFPRIARPRPADRPADAIPIGRPRAALVYPDATGWECFLADENGGSWEITDGSKADAIRKALALVTRFNAEMHIENEVAT